MTVAPDRFRSLQKVLDLGQVCVRIAVIHQGIQEFGGFPNGLLALVEAEVLIFLAQRVVNRLVLVIQAVELSNARGVAVASYCRNSSILPSL